MLYIDFVGVLHKKTSRDYLQRVIEHDKAEAAKVASNFDFDYWDGDRSFGFGGYNYDGRWSVVADSMIKHYKLNNESKILDVGCGKGFLLYEFTKILPGINIVGLDISLQLEPSEVRRPVHVLAGVSHIISCTTSVSTR